MYCVRLRAVCVCCVLRAACSVCCVYCVRLRAFACTQMPACFIFFLHARSVLAAAGNNRPLSSKPAAQKVGVHGRALALAVRVELVAVGNAVAQTAAERAALHAIHLQVSVRHLIQRFQEQRHTLVSLHEQVLEIQQDALALVLVHKRGGHARLAAPTRAPNAMHVVLDLLGHVKVDDVLDVGEVQPLGRHVGGHEHILLALLERLDGELALLLIFRAVHRHRLHALQQQVLVDVVHVAFVFAEDEHRRRRFLQALQQVHNLGLLLHVLHLLQHVQVCGARAADVDDYGLHQGGPRKVLDLLGHGGREQQRLALPREMVHDIADVLLEPEVDQPVRLVQAQVPAEAQSKLLLVEHVVQAARARHHHVDAPAQRVLLVAQADAADAQQRAQARVAGAVQRVCVVLDDLVRLARQFARRADDHAERPLAVHERHALLLLQRQHDHGQRKHERLPAAREGNADHVPSRQDGGKALHLDGGGPQDALGLECVEDAGGEAHVFEVLAGVGDIVTLHEDVPLLPYLAHLLLAHLPHMPWRPPPRLQRFCVLNVFGKLVHTLQRFNLLHSLHEFLLLLLQLLGLGQVACFMLL
mmetsp:Transcript_30466/g.76481  ORF Transcript_30466/g.76481 Transcript_30466/m.76481 type:complete len:586 (-) Transcript_30466:154-1911(-)